MNDLEGNPIPDGHCPLHPTEVDEPQCGVCQRDFGRQWWRPW